MLLFVKPSGGGGGSGGGSGSGSSGEGIGDLPVTSSLRLWLKADAGVTYDGGNNVTAWVDQSGTGNTPGFDPNGSGYPQFKANGVNGKPCVYFNNTKCFVKENLNLQEWTVVHVSRLYYDSDGEGGRIFTNTPGPEPNNVLVGSWNNYDNRMYVSGWVYEGTNTNYVWKNTIGTSSIVSNQSYFYQNGVKLAGPISTSRALNGVGIGGYWVPGNPERAICDIAEILVYDKVLTTQERQQVETYLNAKYAIY